jgi:hypothetical protein
MSKRSAGRRPLTSEELAWIGEKASFERRKGRWTGIGLGLLCGLLGILSIGVGVFEMFRSFGQGLLLVVVGVFVGLLGAGMTVLGLISPGAVGSPGRKTRRIVGPVSMVQYGSGRGFVYLWTVRGIPLARFHDPAMEDGLEEGMIVACDLVVLSMPMSTPERQGWVLGLEKDVLSAS